MTLEIAYEIGRRIQAVDSFFYCPNWFHEQVEGVVIEEFKGEVRRLHTPLGFWNVGCRTPLRELKLTLPWDLVMLDPACVTNVTRDSTGPFWGVVEWDKEAVAPPIYRASDAYLPKERVVEIWNAFRATRPDLKPCF